MKDHNCIWTTGTSIEIDRQLKIKTECDTCGKEMIVDFRPDWEVFNECMKNKEINEKELFKAKKNPPI